MASSMADREGASRLNRKAGPEGWGAYHQGGADLRSASEGILWMPIRYGERNRRFRNRQTGGLPHRLCTAAATGGLGDGVKIPPPDHSAVLLPQLFRYG